MHITSSASLCVFSLSPSVLIRFPSTDTHFDRISCPILVHIIDFLRAPLFSSSTPHYFHVHHISCIHAALHSFYSNQFSNFIPFISLSFLLKHICVSFISLGILISPLHYRHNLVPLDEHLVFPDHHRRPTYTVRLHPTYTTHQKVMSSL